MTEKLYDSDPYGKKFKSHITSAVPTADGRLDIVLESTLFFPEEGGQTCDKGTLKINNHIFDVSSVIIENDTIHHLVSPADGAAVLPAPGDMANGEIDFNHRYSNMQNHTGEHIFSGIIHEKFGYDNVGFHLSDNEVTMDYNGTLTDSDVASVENKVNQVIRSRIPVVCRYPSKEELSTMDYRSKKEIEGPVRIVTIEGVDVCACCAPHVKNTVEVGLLKVLSRQNYKGGTRLSILCGMRAVSDYIQCRKELIEISHLIKRPAGEAYEYLSHLMEERDSLKYEIKKMSGKLLLIEAEKAVFKDKNTFIFFDNETDPDAARECVNQMCKKTGRLFGIFWKIKSTAMSWRYIIGRSSPSDDARDACTLLKKTFGAKGGGSASMVQGNVNASEKDIRDCLDQFLN